MLFQLEIDTAGAAFTRVTNDEHNGEPAPAAEVARILRLLAGSIVDAGNDPANWPQALHDVNGNRCGTAWTSDDTGVDVDGG